MSTWPWSCRSSHCRPRAKWTKTVGRADSSNGSQARCLTSSEPRKVNSSTACHWNDLPSRHERLHCLAPPAEFAIGLALASEARDIVLCSVIVYELRHGAERSPDPAREHTRLDAFLAPFASLPFDDVTAQHCATIRHQLERAGRVIGPHDLQIAAVALQHRLIVVTHNTQEFNRVTGLICEDWET